MCCKRWFDITFALFVIVLLWPIMLTIAALIRVKIGSPVIYRQMRPGLYGKPFKMYKFRSMKEQRDEFGKLLPDENRLTEFGKRLRSTSLDELPEFYNVLKGDMSVVGPRPLLMKYLTRYNKHQQRRHDVKPGITGWTQVNGRNALSWKDKLEMDVWYVKNRSFSLDMRILANTIVAVLRRDGISQDNHVTTEEFEGNGTALE